MEPIIQWVGGKKRLLPKIKYLMPEEYNSFHEIFLGGACLLLNLNPEISYSIEKNINIYMIYENVKNHKDTIIKNLGKIEKDYLKKNNDRKKYYLEKRKEFNNLTYQNTKDSINKTILLLFLNKTCFNALYRENRKGEFNVPFGNGKDCSILNVERINSLHLFLNKKETHIYNEDFTYCLENVKEGDFVYIDPPYYPLKSNSFTNYDKEGFSQEDHDRLIDLFKKLDQKRAKVMLSNSNNDYFKEKLKDFKIYEITVARTLNCKKEERGKTKCEIIITNYNFNKEMNIEIEEEEYNLIEIGEEIEIKVDKNNLYYFHGSKKLEKVEDNIQNLLLDNEFNISVNNKNINEGKYTLDLLIHF